MVNRQNVDFVGADEPVDNAVRPPNHLTYERIGELRHDAPRLGKFGKPPHGCQQPGDDHGGVVRRVLTDKRINSLEVLLRLLSPEKRSHARNRFSTSSWGTTCPASD